MCYYDVGVKRTLHTFNVLEHWNWYLFYLTIWVNKKKGNLFLKYTINYEWETLSAIKSPRKLKAEALQKLLSKDLLWPR